jgi:hypothetical protein
MSARSSLDREIFQTFLASTFAVQESGMSKQSLSGLIEIHKAIAKDELPFDEILDLMAERARIVADATGIAIGLLTGNQLVYRAGSGSGAQYIGQHVTAVLSASARTSPRKEILRVDNAENDARIEAAICRGCDAKALLIIPFYNDHFMAGVLEVLFRDPHSFDVGEMRTYRMMAKLVEEAMAHDLLHRQKGELATRPANTQPAIEETPSLITGSWSDGNPTPGPSIAPVCNATATVPSAASSQCPDRQGTSTKFQLKHPSFLDSPWIFDATVLVIILGLAGWISLHQNEASTMERESITRASASGENVREESNNSVSKTASGTHQNNTSRPRFMRVQVGPNEVDYVAEDVTIRQFTTPVPLSRPTSVDERSDIGDDMTMHTNKYKAEVLPESGRGKSDAIHSAPRH